MQQTVRDRRFRARDSRPATADAPAPRGVPPSNPPSQPFVTEWLRHPVAANEAGRMNSPETTSPARGTRLLGACALISFALALVHVVCIFTGEATARFFTAPRFVLEMIRTGSWLIAPVCLAIVAVLGTFGLYAWSAAGRIQRLPGLRGGLVAVGAIYTLRGLALVPQAITMVKHPGVFPWQVPVFSFVALALGVAHLAGARHRWSALAPLDNRADLHN